MNAVTAGSAERANHKSTGHDASGDMLVKNATLDSSFSTESFDFEYKLSGCAHQSLISDNQMARLFNRDIGPVVCNAAAVTAIKVQRQGCRVAPVPSV
jgi:hypothetical protein